MHRSLVLNGNVLVCVCVTERERHLGAGDRPAFFLSGCRKSQRRKSGTSGGEADIPTAAPREPSQPFSSCAAARGSRKGGTGTRTDPARPSTLCFPLGIRQTEGGGLKNKDV